MPKLHLRASTADANLRVSLCGWMGSRLTDDASEATCARCRRMAAHAILEAIQAQPDELPSSLPYAPRYGARDVDCAGSREIERSRRGEAPEGRTWPTPEAAVRAWVRDRAEGASVRSTSDPDRAHRVQSSRDPSLGGRDHATIDRHRNTALAIERASRDVASLLHAAPCLTPAQCLEVYVLRVVGRPVQRALRRGTADLRSRVTEWVGLRVEDVAEHATERWAVEVTARHVALVTRYFSGAVREALVRSGELRQDARSEAEVERREGRARRWDPSSRIREEIER